MHVLEDFFSLNSVSWALKVRLKRSGGGWGWAQPRLKKSGGVGGGRSPPHPICKHNALTMFFFSQLSFLGFEARLVRLERSGGGWGERRFEGPFTLGGDLFPYFFGLRVLGFRFRV